MNANFTKTLTIEMNEEMETERKLKEAQGSEYKEPKVERFTKEEIYDETVGEPAASLNQEAEVPK